MSKHNVVTATIGGEKYKFSFSLWALMLAEERGLDVSETPLDADEAEKKTGNIREMLRILHIARLPFDEDLELRDLGMLIGMGDLHEVTKAFQKIVKRQFSEDVRDKLAEMQEDSEKKVESK